jgi:hypothetical protein
MIPSLPYQELRKRLKEGAESSIETADNYSGMLQLLAETICPAGCREPLSPEARRGLYFILSLATSAFQDTGHFFRLLADYFSEDREVCHGSIAN